jgi:hypothetical protein
MTATARTAGTATGKTRLTVDLADDDYYMLRMAAASAGKGVTISSLVREMIHDWLEDQQDRVDIAMVQERRAAGGPILAGAEARRRFEAFRESREA